MKVSVQDYNNVTVIELQGELDGDVVELFQKTIDAADIGAKIRSCLQIPGSNTLDPGHSTDRFLIMRPYQSALGWPAAAVNPFKFKARHNIGIQAIAEGIFPGCRVKIGGATT